MSGSVQDHAFHIGQAALQCHLDLLPVHGSLSHFGTIIHETQFPPSRRTQKSPLHCTAASVHG